MLAKAISLIIRHRGKVIIKVNTQGKGQCRCSSVKVVGSECSEPGAVCATLEDCWDWRCIKAIISTKVRSLSWLIRGQEKRINREDPCCCDSVLDAMTQNLQPVSPGPVTGGTCPCFRKHSTGLLEILGRGCWQILQVCEGWQLTLVHCWLLGSEKGLSVAHRNLFDLYIGGQA